MENQVIDLVDTHTHLTDEKFAPDLAETIARAKAAGVRRLINMGDTLASSSLAVELARRYEGLYAGVGIHPEELCELTGDREEKLFVLAQEKKVVAIGEIGLDYHWEKDEERRQGQQKLFIAQLDIARQLRLPVCIHDREAHGDTLAILKKEGRGLRGVLHCYSGSPELAQEFWRLGFFIGVDGPLTYKNAAKLPEVVQKAPRDMVLIETDAP